MANCRNISVLVSLNGPATRSRLALWLALVPSALAGCAGAGSTTDGDHALSLRSGTVELYNGGVTDIACELASKTGQDDFCNRDAVNVEDVARDGQRVAVVIEHETNLLTLFLSDDLGATWSTHNLPSAFNSGVEGTNAFTGDGYAVHLEGGEVYLLIGASHTGAGGFDYPVWKVALVDLTANSYAIIGQVNGPAPLAIAPGHISSAAFTPNFGADGYGAYGISTFDLATRKSNDAVSTCGGAQGACYNVSFTPVSSGFVAYTARSAATGTELCRLSMPEDSPSLSADCAPAANLSSSAAGGVVVDTPAGPLVTFQKSNGEAAAIGVEGGHLVGPYDLGPGAPTYTNLVDDHPRFGGAEFIMGASTANLITLSGAAPQLLPIPPTPCKGSSCGDDARLVGAISLGGDDFLSLYQVNSYPGGRHDHLYARREHAPLAAFVPPPPAVTTPHFENYPSAVAGGALEAMCARFGACVGAASDYGDVANCVGYWLTLNGATTAEDTAYQRFMATGPGCEAFGDTWPAQYWPAQPPCTTGCHGDAWVTSCSFATDPSQPLAFDCAAMGTACMATPSGVEACTDGTTVAACNVCDAEGRAVSCTQTNAAAIDDCPSRGLGCELFLNRPTCTTPLCTASVSGSCDGPIASNCPLAGYVPRRTDCSRVDNLSCDADYGACRPVVDGACAINRPLCIDGSLIYCEATQVHFIDCTAIGFTGCTTVSGTYGDVSVCTP